MQTIQLQPVPRQTVQVQLDNQATQINVYQTAYGLFVDVLLNGTAVISGVIAENLNRIIRSAYLGYSGDLVFVDLAGSSDPIYTGIGTRFVLVYFSAAELQAKGLAA